MNTTTTPPTELEKGKTYNADQLRELIGNRELYVRGFRFSHHYMQIKDVMRDKLFQLWNSFQVDHVCLQDMPVIHVSIVTHYPQQDSWEQAEKDLYDNPPSNYMCGFTIDQVFKHLKPRYDLVAKPQPAV